MGRGSRAAEWALVAVAVCSTAPLVLASAARIRAKQVFALDSSSTPVPVREGKGTREGQRIQEGQRIGELRIARLSLSVPILEGCSSASMRGGACRMVETAQLGGLGTVAVAGHRDAAFRALAGVRAGDIIQASSPDGTFEYVVDTTRIVKPEQVDVVATADHPSLVLITCYPFAFVGQAPNRFVVQAHLRLGGSD